MSARKDVWTAARPAEEDHFIPVGNGRIAAGTHLLIELFGARRIDDIRHVGRTLVEAAEAAQATVLGQPHLHHFTPNNGVSGVVILAESHISIHSWPERGYAALDIFMCGAARPQTALPVLEKAFDPDWVTLFRQYRGELLTAPREGPPEAAARPSSLIYLAMRNIPAALQAQPSYPAIIPIQAEPAPDLVARPAHAISQLTP